MSNPENKTNMQKPRTSNLALLSPVLAVLSYCTVFYCSTLELGRFFRVILFICWFFTLVGFIFGVVALVKIGNSNGMLVGRVSSILGISVSAILIMLLCPFIKPAKQFPPSLACQSHIHYLNNAIWLYSNDYDGQYPIADKWCDLLVKYTDAAEKQFVCPGALKAGRQGRCHYAMNPNCEQNSPNDVVLLFETKGGWNQFGGPEILTTENHNREGCNILFNDGHVEFIRTEQLDKLKWKAEDNKSIKADSVSSTE